MAFNDTFNRLERLAFLIQRKGTGSPQQLAAKMEVSVRTIDNLINYLRDVSEVDIFYCRERHSYCFKQPAEVRFELAIVLESGDSLRGGCNNISNYLLDADFLQCKSASLYC